MVIKMKIQIEQVEQLVAKGDKIFFGSIGEKELIKLLDMQQKIEQAIGQVKIKLEEQAKRIPNFKSIQGDRVKVYYRNFGAKYYWDKQTKIPDYLLKISKKYYINTEELEKYIKEKGVIPKGVSQSQENKKIVISYKR